jgi:hypothetical protein
MRRFKSGPLSGLTPIFRSKLSRRRRIGATGVGCPGSFRAYSGKPSSRSPRGISPKSDNCPCTSRPKGPGVALRRKRGVRGDQSRAMHALGDHSLVAAGGLLSPYALDLPPSAFCCLRHLVCATAALRIAAKKFLNVAHPVGKQRECKAWRRRIKKRYLHESHRRGPSGTTDASL